MEKLHIRRCLAVCTGPEQLRRLIVCNCPADFELPDPTTENITACGKDQMVDVYRVAALYFEVATRKVLTLGKSPVMIQLGPGKAEVCILMCSYPF